MPVSSFFGSDDVPARWNALFPDNINVTLRRIDQGRMVFRPLITIDKLDMWDLQKATRFITPRLNMVEHLTRLRVSLAICHASVYCHIDQHM